MPFPSWLLGAMVAPTPTSALLHSSTMVKAGVFLLIKISPCLGFNMPGFLVMTVGIATFLFLSLIHISPAAPCCPFCLEEVKVGATRCPHCAGAFDAPATAE